MLDPGNLDETVSGVRDGEQLIAQARAIYAQAMNCSDLAREGAWTAHETVNGLPPNNYWAVMAVRTPTAKGVDPFSVWKAHVNTPAMAGLLTFISTALPQLCDLAEKALIAQAADTSVRNVPAREDGGGSSVAESGGTASPKSDSAEGH